jgi:membrane-bound inhibitor of C-type lysozyme
MDNITKQNKLLIILGLFVLALIALFYVEKNLNTAPVVQAPAPVPVAVNAVTYYCQEGILKAVYGKSDVAVTFPDGHSLVLPQSVSADGGRYESGTTVFWSKGDNAFVTEKDKTTYTNCVTGNQITAGGTNTFTDAGKTFSFSYPSEFNFSGGDGSYTQDWRVNTQNLGLLFTVVQIPKSFMPGTNFGDAKFTVGTSADPDAVKNCLVAQNGEKVESSNAMIGNTKFTEITLSDAGAGNFYETTSYRTLRNDQCYAVEYTIHSSNIGNYSPDQGIKEFDQAKITSILEGMAESFKFL